MAGLWKTRRRVGGRSPLNALIVITNVITSVLNTCLQNARRRDSSLAHACVRRCRLQVTGQKEGPLLRFLPYVLRRNELINGMFVVFLILGMSFVIIMVCMRKSGGRTVVWLWTMKVGFCGLG